MIELFFTKPFKALFTKSMANINIKVFKNNKNLKPIARGGEAQIYATSRNTLAKIFFAKQATSNKRSNIETLAQHSFPKGVITATCILTDEKGNFIGYEMKKASGIELGLLFLPHGMKKHFKRYTLIDLVTLSLAIIDLFESIHAESLIVGDINPRNILIENKANISLIDTDSFQTHRPSGVGQAVYTRAINIGKPYNSYMRSISDDTYAISVIVFQIFHYGALPYGSTNIDELKTADYLYSPNSKNNHKVNPELAKSHHRLSLELKNYFYTQFLEQKYLPLSDLKKALKRYKKTLLKK